MASPRPPPDPPTRVTPAPAPPGEPVAILIKPDRPPTEPTPKPPPTPDVSVSFVRNSSFLSQDIEAQKSIRRPVEVPPRKSSIPAVVPPPVNVPQTVASPPAVATPVIKSPPTSTSPAKSSPVKSPPMKSLPTATVRFAECTPSATILTSPPQKKASPPQNQTMSPPMMDLKSAVSASRIEIGSSAPKAPWRDSPVSKEPLVRVDKLSDASSDTDKAIETVESKSEVNLGNADCDREQAPESEELNGVGDKIKKFEKAAEDASATVGRQSRPGSVRGRPRTERLGSDNSREDLPPPATPFKDNVHFDLSVTPADRPPTVLERQQSLTRNASVPAPVRWPRTDSGDGEKIRPEPQKIIKPEFKPMPSPVEVTIRSPSLGAKIGDQFPSHGTAFRNVASPDTARNRDGHKFNDDVNTQNNFKTCKLKSKEKYSVSKGSSYFTRGSEEIWLVKKKDIEEIEERVLDSFRRAGGNVCLRSESMRPSSDSGQSVSFSATMGRNKRPTYARSESLDPQRAGARAQTLKRQTSVACTCGHDKKTRAKTASTPEAPRPRSRSHGDETNQSHVLDKYETLV